MGDVRIKGWDVDTNSAKKWDGTAWVDDSAGGGSGDMTKAAYDPNEDGVIALAQLDTGVSQFKQANHDALPNPHHANSLDHDGGAQDTAITGKADSGHNHSGTYEPADVAIQTHIISAHAPSDAQKNSDILKSEIEAVLTGEIASHTHAGGGGQAFPVGSVFIAAVSTNPATLLGYGTWSQIAQGQFLVGQDPGDTDFDVAEETGGAKTHTHIDHAEFSHSQDASAPKWWDTAGGDSKPDAHPAQSHDSPSHLPPYFVVYCWKRVT